jgi:hypothetical protein
MEISWDSTERTFRNSQMRYQVQVRSDKWEPYQDGRLFLSLEAAQTLERRLLRAGKDPDRVRVAEIES